jgi:3-oxoacyl-[acyl-carrier protein] reductase
LPSVQELSAAIVAAVDAAPPDGTTVCVGGSGYGD